MDMKKPKFSLVIPVAPWRNAEILSSVDNLDYRKDNFEVLVEKGTNPSENRNNGVKKAKGEIIAFLDDDAFLSKDYLKNVDSLDRNQVISIAGLGLLAGSLLGCVGLVLYNKNKELFEEIAE